MAQDFRVIDQALSPQDALSDQSFLYAFSREVGWTIEHLPPLTRLYGYINGVGLSQYFKPQGGVYGDAIISNEFGTVTGTVNIPRNSTFRFLTGPIRISFADNPDSIEQSTFLSEATFFALGNTDTFNVDQRYTLSTRYPTKFSRGNGSSTEEMTILEDSSSLVSNRLDLLAQTFLVDGTIFPNGLLLSSVDLFFTEKDQNAPISIEIRGTSSGIPVSNEIIPNSHVLKYPQDISVGNSTTAGSTIVTDNETITNLQGYQSTLVYRSGNIIGAYQIIENIISSGASPQTVTSVINIYNGVNVGFSSLFLTQLPGYAGYTIERQNPVEVYNLTPITSGISSTGLISTAITGYLDPRTNTQYPSDKPTIGLNFMVRNGIMYKFPDAPANTIFFNVVGGTNPTSVEASLTASAEQLLATGGGAGTSGIVGQSIGDFPATNFQFSSPVYLRPGSYAICLRTNGEGYAVATSRIGAPLLSGSGPRASEITNGALFRTSNTGQRIPDENEDLCFALYKYKFETGVKSLFLENKNVGTFVYDNINLRGTILDFSAISYVLPKLGTTSALDATPRGAYNMAFNNPTVLPERMVANAAASLRAQLVFYNKDPNLSPVLDKEKMQAMMYQNEVDAYEADTSASELNRNGGVARSKYVSQLVQLQPGFDSDGVEVRIDVNRKIGSDIEVFCRVLSANDIRSIGTQDWKLMKLVSNNGTKEFVGTSDTKYVTEYYQILTPDLNYSASTGTTEAGASTSFFEDFNRFQIKVVFYSNTKTTIPKIKNLVATAVIGDTTSGLGYTRYAGLNANGNITYNISDNEVDLSGYLRAPVTASNISVTNLSSITPNLGTVTSGVISIGGTSEGILMNVGANSPKVGIYQNSSQQYGLKVQNLWALANGGGAAQFISNFGWATDHQLLRDTDTFDYAAIAASSNFNSAGGDIRIALPPGRGGYAAYARKGSYAPFTGSHDGLIEKSEEPQVGDIMVDRDVIGKQISDVLTTVTMSSQQNQQGALGVFVRRVSLSDEVVPAALFTEYEEYLEDGKVKRKNVLPTGWDNLKSSYDNTVINSVGEGCINVCGEGGDIRVGDLIVTSNMRGKGMRQADDIVRNYTVAKARENVSFSGSSDVRMIACIYLCG